LKLQVQTLLRSRDDIARAQAIQRLLGGVDRASRLVEQLLALAREEPASPGTKPCETILAESMTLALADVAPLAAARQIELKVAALPDLQVIGDPDSLQILARNLLDNAIRYTPEHGIVRMSLMAGARTATLTVEDSGPGIAMADRRRVFDRFYRVPGTSPTGSGLGLAIVKAIADRHGAVVELTDSMLGGVSIKIVFPLP
jgi:two-component system OmpR family sensor kinase